ncbi:hypothetical protein BTS2_3768 [Bacillus sp. TS-2]|nr:hypothetical protein BTS2_3768 [Bacillus sp. TS-2]
MTEEIEIEEKSLLSKDGFEILVEKWQLSNKDFILQENHYFDTTDMILKNHHTALRVRFKNDTYQLTLKQPHPDGLLETHQPLNLPQFNELKKEGKLPPGEVLEQLNKLSTDTWHFHYLGMLKTYRAELSYNQGLLCFDKSIYAGVEDYEIEFEGYSREHAIHTLENLLHSIGLKPLKTKNKIQRFYEQVQKNKTL